MNPDPSNILVNAAKNVSTEKKMVMGDFYNILLAKARLLTKKVEDSKLAPASTEQEQKLIEQPSSPIQKNLPPPRNKLIKAAKAVLEDALQLRPPEQRPLPGRVEPLGPSERLALGLDCDEVLPGLMLASGKTVKNAAYMRELRVTHIINTASRDVWLPTEKLTNLGVELYQFHVDDVPSANISPYFRPAADLVRRAQQSGGLLVVNCLVGLSRSATLLTAALMLLRHWSLARSLRALRLRRQVRPNLGFIQQLVALEVELKEQGYKLT